MRTASGVAAGGGRLAAPSQREDRTHRRGRSSRGESHRVRRTVVADRRRLSREAVAPQGQADRVDKHDVQLRVETRRGVGLRHVAGHRSH